MKQREGYLFIDHRASPGTEQVGEGKFFEGATISCSHCQAVMIKNPERIRPRAHCRGCDKCICDGCAGVARITGECLPFSKKLEQAYEKAVRQLSLSEI